MRNFRWKISSDRQRHRRGQHGRDGFLSIGPLREILVITAAASLVIAAIWHSKSAWVASLSDQQLTALNCNAQPVRSLDFDEDRQVLVVCSMPGILGEISLESGLFSKSSTPQNVSSVATSKRNSMTVVLSGFEDSKEYPHELSVVRDDVLLFSLELPASIDSSADVRISADGSIVFVIADNGHTIGWDLSTAEPSRWEYQLKSNVLATALSPDGRRMFAATDDGKWAIYDAFTGAQLTSLTARSKCGRCSRTAVWSEDGQRLAISEHHGELLVFQAESGELIWQRNMGFLFARSLAISTDGGLLAVGGFDKKIRIWDVSHPKEPPAILIGKPVVPHNLVFTSADKNLVSGGDDGSVCEWSVATRGMIRELH